MLEVRTSWSHSFPINKSAAHQDLPGFASKQPGTQAGWLCEQCSPLLLALPPAAARELILGHGQAPWGRREEQLNVLDLFAPFKPSTPGSPSCE